MQARFINYDTQEDFGSREVVVQSLRLDSENRPYAIVSDPITLNDSARAEYMQYDGQTQWVVDLA
jgi:hypothetical protein